MRNRVIQVRITEAERRRLQNRMESDGHSRLSIWVRKVLLGESMSAEQKINAMYRKICEEGMK